MKVATKGNEKRPRFYFYKQHFYEQRQAEKGKISSKN